MESQQHSYSNFARTGLEKERSISPIGTFVFPKWESALPLQLKATPISAHYRELRQRLLSADVTKTGNLPVENSRKCFPALFLGLLIQRIGRLTDSKCELTPPLKSNPGRSRAR